MEKTQSLRNGALTHTTASVGKAPLASATLLQRDILRVLSYFDIFQHPLTTEEIYTFLPSNSTSPSAVQQACHSSPLTTYVNQRDGYFYLASANPHTVRERRIKEQRARRHWAMARFMTSIIRHFPFVRGIFVSGELSKGVSSEQGDVDFVIVTENGRLWICRTLLIAFKKLVLLNQKKYFCINHLMTRQNFASNDRNIYTAMEIVTLKATHNRQLLTTYQRANNWTEQFLPNTPSARLDDHSRQRSLLQIVIESLFLKTFADWLDARLMNFWKDVWKKRYPHLSDEKRNEIFHCSSNLSTAYNGDFASKILMSYQQRLAQLGLHD